MTKRRRPSETPPSPAVAPSPAPVAPLPRLHLGLLLALLVVSAAARLALLDRPGELVFDELYYVNAARVVAQLPQPANSPWNFHLPGVDPNLEHTPGAKLLLAATIRLFGDGPWAWRVPSALFGTAAIFFLWAIARRLRASASAALLAAFAFAFDDLAFVHGRLATLDMPQLSLMLAGLWAYLAGRPVLAGLGLAASTLCKVTGLYGVAALLGFEALRLLRRWREGRRPDLASLRPIGTSLAVYLVVFPAALALLDLPWGIFKNPFEHIRYVLSYGYTLNSAQGSLAAVSQPWQWLLNEVPMVFFRGVDTVVHGRMNPLVVFATLPALGFAAWSAKRHGDDLSLFALALFAGTYAPYWLAAWAGRVSYLYYFLPAIPAVALAAASFVATRPSRLLPWACAAAVLVGFLWRFPYQGGLG